MRFLWTNVRANLVQMVARVSITPDPSSAVAYQVTLFPTPLSFFFCRPESTVYISFFVFENATCKVNILGVRI